MVESREWNGYLHVYGALDEESVQGASHIYLKLARDGETRYVEAFPIYESSLLDEGTETVVRANGFSAYLPEEEGEGAVVSVVVQTGGGYFEYTVLQ